MVHAMLLFLSVPLPPDTTVELVTDDVIARARVGCVDHDEVTTKDCSTR